MGVLAGVAIATGPPGVLPAPLPALLLPQALGCRAVGPVVPRRLRSVGGACVVLLPGARRVREAGVTVAAVVAVPAHC